jgi:hypothetical protein
MEILFTIAGIIFFVVIGGKLIKAFINSIFH